MRARSLAPVAAACLLAAAGGPAGATTVRDVTGVAGVAGGNAARPGAPTVRADFNNDGAEDLAVASPFEDVGSVLLAGAVHVVLGGDAGLSGTGSQLITQNSSGIESAAERSDWFGNSLAAGDFDGDGFTDLAIGTMNEGVGTLRAAGVVHVLYGSPTGLQTVGSQMFDQDSPGVADQAEAVDQFGNALAVGDFDDDGVDDLAIGAHLDTISARYQAGLAHVLYGTSGVGITASGSALLSQLGTQVPSEPEARDWFGYALAAGDFDRDGRDDLAVGARGESAGAIGMAGAVNVFEGSANGVTTAGSQIYTQDSAGIGGAAEAGDQFGSALTSGDFDGNGFADLAVGAPTDGVGTVQQAGVVNTLRGTGSGLTGNGGVLIHQDVGDLESNAERLDNLGSSLAAGDFDADGADDLVVGVPFEDNGTRNMSGVVHVLYGVVGRGPSLTGTQMLQQGFGGLGSTAEPGDFFGSALAVSDFDGDGREDLAVGVPGETVGTLTSAGTLQVVDGSANGLTGAGSQLFTQDSPGLADSVESGDNFGGALAALRSGG